MNVIEHPTIAALWIGGPTLLTALVFSGSQARPLAVALVLGGSFLTLPTGVAILSPIMEAGKTASSAAKVAGAIPNAVGGALGKTVPSALSHTFTPQLGKKIGDTLNPLDWGKKQKKKKQA